MIAQLKRDGDLIATLQDDMQWDCDDAGLSAIWNDMYPIGPGALPLDVHIQGLLQEIVGTEPIEIVWIGVPAELLDGDEQLAEDEPGLLY